MARGWWSVAVALALAGPAVALPGPAAPDTSNALNCGGLAPFSSACQDPQVQGKPRAGRWVNLQCWAQPNPVLGLAYVGPYGPWACWVHME
jgi:hypothetical protein